MSKHVVKWRNKDFPDFVFTAEVVIPTDWDYTDWDYTGEEIAEIVAEDLIADMVGSSVWDGRKSEVIEIIKPEKFAGKYRITVSANAEITKA